MPCSRCRGNDDACAACGGTGETEIVSCPRKLVGPGTRTVLRLARFAAKGTWPEPGGTLDQTLACQEAFDQIWAEEAAYDAEDRRRARQQE